MGFVLLARRDWDGGGGLQRAGSGGVGEGVEIIPGGNLIGPALSLWFGGLKEWPHDGVGCLKHVAFLAGSSIFQALSC